MTKAACHRYPLKYTRQACHHGGDAHGAKVQLKDSPRRYYRFFFYSQGRRHRKSMPLNVCSCRSLPSGPPHRSGPLPPRPCPLQSPNPPAPLTPSACHCAHFSAARATSPRTPSPIDASQSSRNPSLPRPLRLCPNCVS